MNLPVLDMLSDDKVESKIIECKAFLKLSNQVKNWNRIPSFIFPDGFLVNARKPKKVQVSRS